MFLDGYGMAVIVIVGIILGYAATKPSEFTISRELTMHASAETIFPYINNSKKMDSWNPWSDFDPSVKMNFSGPEEGVGASTFWEGGKKLGTGSATVIESVANSKVVTKLVYTKPFEMNQTAEMLLTQSGDQTTVKWSVSGHNKWPCCEIAQTS